MQENFYTVLTYIGKSKITQKSILGSMLKLTKIKVGDGDGSSYNPTESQVELRNKVWDGSISSISLDEKNHNWIVIDGIIPNTDGGFTIREVGVFDDEDDLIAIGKYPETYKPVFNEGSTKDLLIRMILEVSNSNCVSLEIDPNVILATKKDIQVLDNKIKNIKVPVTSVNKKIGDIELKAENIKCNDGQTVESSLDDISKEIKSIELTADKVSISGVTGIASNNVKGAIQELFTNADNAQKGISTVIGSPLSASDTLETQKSKIQNFKNALANNLSIKEQNSSGNESLQNLINKVANINVGKRWATGTWQKPKKATNILNVRNLSFKPRLIIAFLCDDSTDVPTVNIKQCIHQNASEIGGYHTRQYPDKIVGSYRMDDYTGTSELEGNFFEDGFDLCPKHVGITFGRGTVDWIAYE